MYKFIDDILVIEGKSTFFFDPKSLSIFSKTNSKISNERMVEDFKSSQKLTSLKNLPPSEALAVSLELHLLDDCNLKCKYCYHDDSCKKKTTKKMSPEIVKKAALFALKNFPNAKYFDIGLFGGEPLLYFSKLPKLVKTLNEVFKDKKIAIGFPTNGTILDDEILSFIKEHHLSFQISCDGPEEIHNFLRGGYKTIEKNLEKFKEARPSLSVRATITPYNLDLSKLFFFFKEKGFKKIALSVCSSSKPDLKIENIDKLLDEFTKLKEIYLSHLLHEEKPIILQPFFQLLSDLQKGRRKLRFCGAGRTIFTVSVDGSIYNCHRFVGNLNHKIGDIESGFYKEFQDEPLPNMCESCFAKNLCMGGCKYEKELFDFENICKLKRHQLFLAISLFAELSKHKKVFNRLKKILTLSIN